MAKTFGWGSFALRLIFAILIVFCTYNPHQHSYLHWAILNETLNNPYKVIAGLVLFIGWVIYIRATVRSLGGFGLLLAAVLFSSILWLLVEWQWIALENQTMVIYAVMTIISFILAIGMSWSHLRRRMTGQIDIDDVDEVD